MLPPVSVVTSSILMNFLNSNSKSDKFESLTSAPDSIISETTTAAILVDKNMLIQAVNSAVNSTTGFTPDQILGQKVDWLIPSPSNEHEIYSTDISINSKFYATIESMLDQSIDEPYVVLMTKCLTENGSLIPAKTTVLCLDDETCHNRQVVLFIRDLTSEAEMEKDLQEAKSRTDKLLKSIIPEKIDDLNIELTADLATVIVIELSGITDYVHTMSPQSLMTNLRLIYEAFEKRTKEFPLISIVKTDSEIVFLSAGLFDHVGQIDSQVEQSVSYCMKMIGDIEVLNEEIDIDLHLRIGVNVGGPVLGKILNEKTPCFEIIGSFIELAQRMAFDGDPDVIQVGENVLQYLDREKFVFENGKSLINPNGMMDQVFTVSNVVI